MNRERLTILRDHLAGLPDERVQMSGYRSERDCGTVACIAGWAEVLWPDESPSDALGPFVGEAWSQLIMPRDAAAGRRWNRKGDYTRSDAIAAIQSMLDSPDDDALPVWPEKAEAGQ